SPACRILTYQPHPAICGDPSTSHEYGLPSGPNALHSAVITVPLDAATTGVPLGTPMSTPWCVGRSGVLKPDQIGPSTGTIHPAADSSPGPAHSPRLTVTADARPPPSVNAFTIAVASGSCFA